MPSHQKNKPDEKKARISIMHYHGVKGCHQNLIDEDGLGEHD